MGHPAVAHMVRSDEARENWLRAIEIYRKAIERELLTGSAESTETIRSLQRGIAELEEQIEEYDELKSGCTDGIRIRCFDDVGPALIKLRIARNYAPEDLASELGMSPEQLLKHEFEGYRDMTVRQVCEVLHTLGVDITGA